MNRTEQTATVPAPQDTASRWVKEVSGLVSPPDICLKVFELVESDRASAEALGAIIGHDPNLTARLLKIVNSSYYHFSRRIDTVSRAVAIIGISELYSLVIAISAVKTFAKIPGFLVNIDTFWRHSLLCALLARILARRCRVLHPERLFVAGLLHDIGSLVLYHRAPEASRDLLLAAKGNEFILARTETKEFGFNHADLGGLLLELWRLPQEVRQAVACHHRPAAAEGSAIEAALVHIADALANRAPGGGFCGIPAAETLIDESAWRGCGLRTEDVAVEDLIDEAGLQLADTIGLFTL